MDNAGWTYFPKGPDVDCYEVRTVNSGQYLVFPSNMESPEKVIPIVEDFFIINDPNKEFYVTPEDAFMVLARENMYSERDIAVWMKWLKDAQFIYGGFPTIGEMVTSEIYNKIVGNEITPAAAVRTIVQMAQTSLDEEMKK